MFFHVLSLDFRSRAAAGGHCVPGSPLGSEEAQIGQDCFSVLRNSRKVEEATRANYFIKLKIGGLGQKHYRREERIRQRDFEGKRICDDGKWSAGLLFFFSCGCWPAGPPPAVSFRPYHKSTL